MHYIEGLKAGTPRNLETEITVINLFCEGASISFRPKGSFLYNIKIKKYYI